MLIPSGGKLECTKMYDLPLMVAEFYVALYFWVHKKVWPPLHLHQSTPSNNWPVPKHSTSAPLFKLPVNFRILRWCRERSWSPGRLVRITFIWKTSEVSCYYSLFFICKIKSWNVILVVILCKLNTWPNCHVYKNAIAFKCIFSLYDQKSVSRLFTVILRHSVVEYSFRAWLHEPGWPS